MSIAVTPTPERTTRHLHSESQTLGRLRSQTTASPAERPRRSRRSGACTWPLLYRQFGADPARANDKATLSNFRADCLRELEKIQRAWPDLHYRPVKGALVVLPSAPRIAPSQKLRLVMGE